jgi:hypothetical protein
MGTMGEISDHPELLALYRTHLFAPASRIYGRWWNARVRKEFRDVPTDIAAASIADPLFLYSLTLLGRSRSKTAEGSCVPAAKNLVLRFVSRDQRRIRATSRNLRNDLRAPTPDSGGVRHRANTAYWPSRSIQLRQTRPLPRQRNP